MRETKNIAGLEFSKHIVIARGLCACGDDTLVSWIPTTHKGGSFRCNNCGADRGCRNKKRDGSFRGEVTS